MVEAEKNAAVDWTTLAEVKDSELPALIADLKEAEQAVKDAEERKEAIRALISEAIKPVGVQPILCAGKRLQWVAGRVTNKLDRALLVKAGVTPSQLQKGTATTISKPFLDVKPVKEEVPLG